MKNAVDVIDPSYISDTFAGNRENLVGNYAKCMQKDLHQKSGSQMTALFEWNDREQNEKDGDKRGSEFVYKGDGKTDTICITLI